MATIYVAQQLNIEREVAVKVLNPLEAQDQGIVERFKSEARIISKLRHPNTLKLFDHGTTEDGTLYIVMELLQGQTLSETLRAGALSPKRTLELLKQVSLSLAEAHQHGIIHRDLKPGNLFLEQVGDQEIVKVLDFGIAKTSRPEAGPDLSAKASQKTVAGTLIGTPAYMSPEQAEAQPVKPQSDLYSLGVIAYQCLTGVLPFEGQPIAQIAAHAMDPPPPFETRAPKQKVPQPLEALVMQLLHKDPQQRPASASALVEVIDRLLKDAPAQPEKHKPGLLLPALVLAGLGGIGALGYIFMRPPSPVQGPVDAGALDSGRAQDLGAALLEDASSLADAQTSTSGEALDAGATDSADAAETTDAGWLHLSSGGVALSAQESQGFAADADFGPLLAQLRKPLVDCYELKAVEGSVFVRFVIQQRGMSTSMTLSPANEDLRRCLALNLPDRLRWPPRQGPAAVYGLSVFRP